MNLAARADLDRDDQLRSRRLGQITTVTSIGMAIAAAQYLLKGQTATPQILALGILLMLLCKWLNRIGKTPAASTLFVVALIAMLGVLIWIGEGLIDSGLLALPMVLIMAALLVPTRQLLLAMLLILALVLAVAVATAWGWRADRAQAELLNRSIDTVIILLISAFAVWLLIGDLNRALQRLKEQVEQYHADQESLTYLSQHDGLTQLPNRILGRSRMEQAIANAHRNGGQVALLFVDLDNFKSINDSLGHAAGDHFLQQVASRLLASVRQTDVVSRQGGDEFLVGITDLAKGEVVSTVAEKILIHMAKPFVVHGTELTSSCSIGIAVFPDNGDSFETLLRHADISVYHAKEDGRNTWRFYDETMNTQMQEDLQMVAGLRQALAGGELLLYYQPVLDLASGQVIGAEALLRWNRAGVGLVSPAQFIPVAERSGLIVEIGQWVVEEACRQMVQWQSASLPRFVLAINLSPVQFRRGNIEQVIGAALTQAGLDPALLELEITESTLIQDSEKFIGALQKLKALGLRIAIDDFGTGYSNLSYLQRFSIDKLKIDQSFVRRLMDGPQEKAIVSAIVHIARSLNLKTTAEGIEDEPIRQCLAELGCDQGQGYLFARPMPAEDFAVWLKKSNPKV